MENECVDGAAVCSIYFLDLVEDQMIRLQFVEDPEKKSSQSSCEEHKVGVQELKDFVSVFCHGRVVPFPMVKDPILDTEHFEVCLTYTNSWPEPSAKGKIFVTLIPKEFGKDIKQPFTVPFDFHYESMEQSM